MKTAEEQSSTVRTSGLDARQYRVMGWFLIVLAMVAGTIIVADFWQRLGSAAPMLVLACVMDLVAGAVLLYLGKKKAKLEHHG